MNTLDDIRRELIGAIEARVGERILERSNADLLIKLINRAESITEAISIAELGTTYKRTGFHFDVRLEKSGNTIKYFKKNEEFSFSDGDDAPLNKLIVGDNYDALLNLQIEYKGMVDVIYIDPPYGKDSMGAFADTNYDNALTRDNLLSMLYPRILLAKTLLADDGLFFCSIDDKNYAYVKCMLDEIFEEKHFINTFVWKKNSSGKTEKDKYTVNSEYVLLYAKTASYDLKEVFKPLAEATKKLYKLDDHDGRGKYRLYPLQKPAAPGPQTTYDYVDNQGRVWKCPPKGWRMKYEKLKELENDGRLCFANPTLSEKAYWNERKNDGKRIDTLWTDLSENSAGTAELVSILGDVFDNPKPVDLIKRCISVSHDNALVLDFFAGSGTTGQAVLELNAEDGGERRFLLCTNNEITKKTPNGIAFDVTVKRLKRTMTGACYDGDASFKWLEKHAPLGGSLDVYEIGEVANFEQTEGKTPFDVIDETLYGKKFSSLKEKIEWVCETFEETQRYVETDTEWKKRVEET